MDIRLDEELRAREALLKRRQEYAGRLSGWPLVSIIVATNRQGKISNILSNVGRQAYKPVELILVLHGIGLNPDSVQRQGNAAGIRRLRVLTADSRRSLGFALNQAAEAASGEFVAKFDDDDYYSPNFLTDLIAAFTYSKAGVVGKLSFYIYLSRSDCTMLYRPGNEHQYTDWLAGPTLVIKRDIWERVRFPNVRRGEISLFLQRCCQLGVKLYSADRFNFAYIRAADPAKHTSVYPATDKEWLTKGPIQFQGRDFDRLTV